MKRDECHGGLGGTVFVECHRQYTVHCAGCAAQEIEWLDNLKEALNSFRALGWRRRKGLWWCRYCGGK